MVLGRGDDAAVTLLDEVWAGVVTGASKADLGIIIGRYMGRLLGAETRAKDLVISWAFRRQARNIARLLPVGGTVERERIVMEAVRASGDCICDLCRLPYSDHPDAPEAVPTYTILCNGQRVKL